MLSGNRSPSTTINLHILKEIWRGESVDYSTLQIFVCPVHSLIDSQKRNKLSPSLRNILSSDSPKEPRF